MPKGKTRKAPSDRDLALSVAQIIGATIYIIVSWQAWINDATSTLVYFAPLVWGIAMLSSFSLLFLALQSINWGWSKETVGRGILMSMIAGAALFALAAGYQAPGVVDTRTGNIGSPYGSVTTFLFTLIAFAITWTALARKRAVKYSDSL